jgi:hypothetical protein
LAARGEDEPKSLIYSGFYQNGALWHTDVLVTPPPTIKNASSAKSVGETYCFGANKE